MRVGEEDFADMRVPEKFWETHADCFESAAGGDDDADGHSVGGVFVRSFFHARWWVGRGKNCGWSVGRFAWQGLLGLADAVE